MENAIVNDRKEHVLFLVDTEGKVMPMVQPSFCSANELGNAMISEYPWVKEVHITQLWLRSILDDMYMRDCAIFSMVRA